MKYQSELIKEIIDTRGHDKSSLHYESECIETWIEENKGAYPKLTDYQSEWLNYIIENPIGKFPYETITDVTNATIDNVVPLAYQSAILKGKTDENLQSVKMPVLTTTGKNLIKDISYEQGSINGATGQFAYSSSRARTVEFIKLRKNVTYTFSVFSEQENVQFREFLFYSNANLDTFKNGGVGTYRKTFTYTPQEDEFCGIVFINNTSPEGVVDINSIQLQLEQGSIATSYTPYKSIILTVNEDVTLRSNGSVHDELDCLTGKLTQRIDENGEVLSQEIVKTLDLTITNQDGETLNKLKPIEGTMHLSTSSETIAPLFSGEIPVEAITQNLASFIEEE